MDAVLNRKQRVTPPVPHIFDGEKEARLIALACSQPPEGRAKWTLRLLETKVASDPWFGGGLSISRSGFSGTVSRSRNRDFAPS